MLLIVLLIVVSCGKKNMGNMAGSYKTMTVDTASRTMVTEYPATLQGRQDVDVYPQVSGLISQILISEGDCVRKGQLLFVIDQVPYKAALLTATANVENAEAAVETARMTAESKQMLYDDGVVSDFELRQARNTLRQREAELKQAKAELTNARNNLSYTEVRSPVDGTAGMISHRVGALVGPNMEAPLISVSDNSEVHAYFSLTEKQVLDLQRKTGGSRLLDAMPEVELVMSDGNHYDGKGKIDAVSGVVESGTGTVQVRATFANAKGLLRSGGTANVVLPSVRKGCIVIPQEATYELQDKVFVYKVLDGKAKSAQVRVTDLGDGKEYIVESGLKVGDVIVAEGAGLLHEGAEVVVQDNRK